jgi:hypothetical protein
MRPFCQLPCLTILYILLVLLWSPPSGRYTSSLVHSRLIITIRSNCYPGRRPWPRENLISEYHNSPITIHLMSNQSTPSADVLGDLRDVASWHTHPQLKAFSHLVVYVLSPGCPCLSFLPAVLCYMHIIIKATLHQSTFQCISRIVYPVWNIWTLW